MSQLKSKSLARVKLYELLSNTKDGDIYDMQLHKTQVPLEKAGDFVHRIRVELSRVRRKVVEDHNRVPKHFRLLFLEAKNSPDKVDYIVIRLQRTSTKVTKVSEELDAVLDQIAGGPLLDG